MSNGKRIVLATFGSLGDVHPYIALANGLRERGHSPVLATCPIFRDKVESLGLPFAPLRPDAPEPGQMPEFMKRVMDLRRGPETVIREIMMPALRESYDDLQTATSGADLLVGHPLTFAARLVAEKTGLPWASALLAPIGFFSAMDPPSIPGAALLDWLRPLRPYLHRPLFKLARRSCRSWTRPWHALRAELGLPATSDDPCFEGQHSPALVLALFSGLLAEKQPDWPGQTAVTGFLFYDRHEGHQKLSEELTQFLAAGPPPIVFTLGSSAVQDAGRFFEHSARAAELLGRRAILLIGIDLSNQLARLPEGVAAFEYAPFSELFPSAAAIVHQGGVGTTAQAMRSGRPMLIVPYAHDQPDNAARMVRLGVARSLSRYRYTAERAAAELKALLDDPRYARRADQVGKQIRDEDGVGSACAALERMLIS
ncbi:MAG: glycosyltransferase [Gemmataceae bacterium]